MDTKIDMGAWNVHINTEDGCNFIVVRHKGTNEKWFFHTNGISKHIFHTNSISKHRK